MHNKGRASCSWHKTEVFKQATNEPGSYTTLATNRTLKTKEFGKKAAQVILLGLQKQPSAQIPCLP